MTEALRAMVEEDAERRGSSINAEVVRRLEWSFDRTGLLPEALRLQYGRDLAGILMLLGSAMLWADVFRRVDDAERNLPPYRWVFDADTYDAAVAAARTVLEALRPPEPVSGQVGRESGADVAANLLVAVRDGTGTGLMDDADVEAIHGLIGHLLNRINPKLASTLNQGKAKGK
jgi:hypothetical protein